MKKYFIFLLLLFYISSSAEELTLNSLEMQELARNFRLEVQRFPGVIRAPLPNDYLQHLGMLLARHRTDLNIHYAFFIINSPEINAFAGPGGTIAINSALILTTTKESELAAVLAHEIAHSDQKHWLKDLNRQQNMKIPMIASMLAAAALTVLNPAIGGGAMVGGMTRFQQNEINYTRSHEKEADRIGIQLLYEADFNPQGMVDFFKKMYEQERYRYMGDIPAMLLTHPVNEERIADAENRIAALPKKHYINNSDYFFFKEMVRVLSTNKPAQLAHDYYQKKLKEEPGSATLRYGYALALMKSLKFSEAKPVLETLNQQSPHNLYYLLALSGCELGLKNTSHALSIMEKLYTDYPDSLPVILDYSNALIQFNHYQKAQLVIEEGLEEYPNNIPLLQNLAQAQSRNHQMARAYLTRAKILMQTGTPREAMMALRNARASSKDALLDAQIDAQIKMLEDTMKNAS